MDEAHERSLCTDVCFALMKRILAPVHERILRREGGEGGSGGGGGGGGGGGVGGGGVGGTKESNLAHPRGAQRLIIASATLEASRFSSYFFDAPIVGARGRAFPVAEFHAERPLPSDAARMEAGAPFLAHPLIPPLTHPLTHP